MAEMTPAQQGAHLMARMLRNGPINAAAEAERMGISSSSMYRLLEEVSALHTVAVANDRGYWYVNALEHSDYDIARRMLVLLKAELEATPPGTLFCRALSRRETAQLVRLLCNMVEGVPPAKP